MIGPLASQYKITEGKESLRDILKAANKEDNKKLSNGKEQYYESVKKKNAVEDDLLKIDVQEKIPEPLDRIDGIIDLLTKSVQNSKRIGILVDL